MVSALFAVFLSSGQAAFTTERPETAYSESWLTPDQILLPDGLSEIQSRNYVRVRGMAVYYSNPADGDHHFSIIDLGRVTPGQPVAKATLHQFGLTCEIKPAMTLGNLTALRRLKRDKPGTHRFVEVKGYLRFGTEGESGHDAVRTFVHGGRSITGHWEIHPVESVQSMDSETPFASGPSADFRDPLGGEMAVLNSWAAFAKVSKPNNHVELRARVTTIRAASDGSGDHELKLVATSGPSPRPSTWATVAPYFVESYDPATKTLRFKPGTLAPDNQELRVNQSRRFFGLRTWRFAAGQDIAPRLSPIMRISPLN